MSAAKKEKVSLIDQAILDTMELVKKREQRLENILPAGENVQRFTEGFRLALALNPDLLKCTSESRLRAFMRAARTGLPPDGTGGFGYMVPYRKRKQDDQGKWHDWQEAEFLPGYKGMIMLAKALGIVTDIQPVLVFERDVFEVEEGDSPRILHKPHVTRKRGEDAGSVIAAYSRVLYPNGARVIKGMLYLPDLDRVADSSKSKNGPRKQHPTEMQKKDTIRNAFKTLGVPSEDAYRRLHLTLAIHDAAESEEGTVPPELAALEMERERSAADLLRKRLGVPEALTEPLGNGEPSPEEQQEILAAEYEAEKR